MDSDDTMDDSGRNLMHQTNEKIHLGENAKVTQHDPDFVNADEGDDEEHLEAPDCPIIAANVAKNNSHICQSENVLEGHTRYRPRS